jgi:CubicO group peptidase (beta-lactamase class C family)
MSEHASRRRFLKQAGAAALYGSAFAPLSRGQAKQIAAKLKLDTSVAKFRADLQGFIPELMKHHGVPGLSIAIIRDARISWSQGFGIKSVVTKEPVTTSTPFEAASFSKAAFAYATLKLVDKGKLDLDTPLWQYKPDFFLPDDPRSKLVTARMILSHSSGLRGRPSDKIIKFEAQPGEKWAYSPLGYGYLQRIVEHLTGQPLEEFMQTNLLRPFAMLDSSYDWNERYEKEAAKGHDWKGERVADRNFYEKFRSFSAEEKAKILAIQPEDAAPGAGFSLTTTPTDYARLLIEIMQPSRKDEFHLSDKMLNEMLKPQIKVSNAVSWGLGWEIERGLAGDAFYHYGNSSNFQNIAIAFRGEKAGVVIMTNSGNGLRLTEKLAARSLGSTHLPYTFSFA